MSHLVITIGCEYGAKGNQIGRKIAEDLGFQFYDRNIVDAIIHEVGIPGEIMEKVEEGVTIVGKGAEGEERGEFSQYADLTKRSCTENDYPQVVGQRILCDYRSFRRLYSKRT